MSKARGFRLGKKEIHLPNFTLTLVRNPLLPPSYAAFIVPLHLNKFDLRDYLYNAYDIKSVSIRSYVKQQKVRASKPKAIVPRPRQWFRPRSTKRMIVQLEKPFVWPDKPESMEPWSKKTYDAVESAQNEDRDLRLPDAAQKPTMERASIAEQAQRLLRGDERWKEIDVTAAHDVEKDVPLRI